VVELEHAEHPEDAAPQLAYRLDTLATWLFYTAGAVVVVCIVAGLLALSTNIDTQGLVSPQAENSGRTAIGLGMIGVGLAGGGIIAGLAGILKALVHRDNLLRNGH
jgi:hypothetical protein